MSAVFCILATIYLDALLRTQPLFAASECVWDHYGCMYDCGVQDLKAVVLSVCVPSQKSVVCVWSSSGALVSFTAQWQVNVWHVAYATTLSF